MFGLMKIKNNEKQTHTMNIKLYWIVLCMVYAEDRVFD